jgi:hypothetical protein
LASPHAPGNHFRALGVTRADDRLPEIVGCKQTYRS